MGSSFLDLICVLALLLASVSTASSSSSSIHGGRFSGPSTARSLLQIKNPCKMDFEFKNYTIITSQCKGPRYPRVKCCDALLRFACPYADEINDLTTDCADIMFSYINIHGNYPPGLFAHECQGDKQGLACPWNYTESSTLATANTSSSHQTPACAFITGILLISMLF